MKFFAFKEFRALRADDIKEVISYLSIDIKKMVRELQLGLTKLSFGDNFESFVTEVTIASGQELPILNKLQGGVVPSARIVIRGGVDSQNIVDGSNAWTTEYVYLQNVGATTVTATVLFIK